MSRYVVVAFKEDEPDRHCVLTGPMCTIGRAPGVDLVLPDASISRKHAILKIAGDHLLIEDQESMNGIFLNGVKVGRSFVQEGDFLTVGAYTVVARTLGDSDDKEVPKGKTLCIGFDKAKELHEKAMDAHSSRFAPALYRTAMLFSERLPLNDLLYRVLSIILGAVHARRGAFLLQRSDGADCEVAASLDLDAESDDIPVSRTLTNHVLRSRTALLTEHAQSDPRFYSSETVIRHGICEAMCAPLCGARGAVGVVYVDSTSDTNCLSERELEFLTTIGHVVGMAVENRMVDERTVRQERLAALGQAIAGISHDVRGILAGTKAGSELMLVAMERNESSRMVSACDTVKRTVDTLETYLSDLLAYVREPKLVLTATPVCSMIREVLETIRPRAEERGVEIIFDGEELGKINIDYQQIHRVLLNVVQNAIDACPKGGGTVTISAGFTEEDLIVRITDTGVGITPENIPRLWEPFFTTKRGTGTGLGLATSYRIVEQHNGRISVASELGKGTTVTLLLPIRPTE